MNATTNSSSTELRVVSVSEGPDGPQFTLSGELTSVSQLVKTVLASPDLLAVLTPTQVKHFDGLQSGPSWCCSGRGGEDYGWA